MLLKGNLISTFHPEGHFFFFFFFFLEKLKLHNLISTFHPKSIEEAISNQASKLKTPKKMT